MDNKHQKWQQGYFIDQFKYRDWSNEEKEEADREEKHLVRPGPTENVVCRCGSPDMAKWIAERLNRAAELEERFYRSLARPLKP